MSHATNRQHLDLLLDIYDEINVVYLENKKRLAHFKTSRRSHLASDETLDEDALDVAGYSQLFQNVEARNGRALREGGAGLSFNVFDSQSTPSASRSPHVSDHLTVLTSVTSSSTIRHEELALVLLRGLIERYMLKVNPCQNPEREMLDESYMTHGKMYTPNQWKDVMQLARAHSSECTVWLARLYPHVAVLQTEVGFSGSLEFSWCDW